MKGAYIPAICDNTLHVADRGSVTVHVYTLFSIVLPLLHTATAIVIKAEGLMARDSCGECITIPQIGGEHFIMIH